LSSLEKGCLRFERFRLALFKNRRLNKMREGMSRVTEAADWFSDFANQKLLMRTTQVFSDRGCFSLHNVIKNARMAVRTD